MIIHFGSNDPTYVYRLYDADGDLLYVGVAFEPEKRWKQHRETARWWPHVVRREAVLYPTRREAFDAELRAIKSERPKHNTQGSERPYMPAPRVAPTFDVRGRVLRIRHHETQRVVATMRIDGSTKSLKNAHAATLRCYPDLSRIRFEQGIRDCLEEGAAYAGLERCGGVGCPERVE